METNDAFEYELQEKKDSDINTDNKLCNKDQPCANNGDTSVTGSHFKEINLDDEVHVKIDAESNTENQNEEGQEPRFVYRTCTKARLPWSQKFLLIRETV